VHWDGMGWCGESLDVAFRLLDAPEVKRRLVLRATAATVLVVSDDIHRSVVRQGYEGIDAQTFDPVVRVRIAGRVHRGWVQDEPPRAHEPVVPPGHFSQNGPGRERARVRR